MKSATQDWVQGISLMQQSVLFGLIRGPDGVDRHHPVKPIIRWYRRCVLISAFDGRAILDPAYPGGGSFTGPSCDYLGDQLWQQTMLPIVNKFMDSRDTLPFHFWMHMLHAIQIVGYKHPEPDIRYWWRGLYLRMVAAMHLFPETKVQMDQRLGDDIEGWKARDDETHTTSV